MKRLPGFVFLFLAFHTAWAIQTPTGLVSRTGDSSIVLHWNPVLDSALAGYRVYRSTHSSGPFVLQNASVIRSPGFCDLNALDGQTNFYEVAAVTTRLQESAPSAPLAATAQVFANDNQFLDYVQETAFDYFWYLANPCNGLVPDRSSPGSACSIAAVGFGLTAIGIGIDHGWISRTQGTARVLRTLNTFWNGPEGTNRTGVIGYNGWFYHFLDMKTGLRAGSELSSIDTVWLLAGILYAKQYFNGHNADESAIRTLADSIFNRVNWDFMSRGTDAVAMGWQPGSGFSGYGNWPGYDEAMLLYSLGLGAATNPLPASAWSRWAGGYTWTTNYGLAYVPFSPMFGHQYSHCWVDFRNIADPFMSSHDSTYFENSRRAALAQRMYCALNPLQRVGYSSNVWGLTACDGPNMKVGGTTYAGYAARGAPDGLDDNTIAPTAAGGSLGFAPEIALPTLRYFYDHFRRNIWTPYGFRDAFNQAAHWWDADELGIDEGPIVLMIENYRTQGVWRRFMRNQAVQRGLQRAGFVGLPSVAMNSRHKGSA